MRVLGQPATDDRGRPVEILRVAGFAPWPITGDRRIGILLARLIALPWHNRRRRRWWHTPLMFCILFFPFAVTPALMWLFGRNASGMGAGFWFAMVFPLAVMVVLIVPTAYGFYLLQRRIAGPEIVEEILREGLCASCGYNTHGATVETDGCVVCPECGAAWNTARMVRRAAFAGDAKLGDTIKALTDGARGRYMPWRDDTGDDVIIPLNLVSGKEPSRIVSDDAEAVDRVRMRRKTERRRGTLASCFSSAVLLGAFGFVMLGFKVFVERRAVAEFSWHAVGLLVMMLLGLVGVFVLWRRPPVPLAADLLAERLCPGCLLSLKCATADEAGVTRCTTCNARWRFRRTMEDRVAEGNNRRFHRLVGGKPSAWER